MAAVMCDERLFHRRAAARGNALSPTIDRCRPETLMRQKLQNVIVVWLQCLLVDVVPHIGTLAPDHAGIYMPKL